MSRRSVAALVVVYAIAMLGVVGAYRLVDSVRSATDEAERFREQEPSHRLTPGGWNIDAHRPFMVAASAFVGRRDTFAVVKGPLVHDSTFLTARFLPTALRSQLLPARMTSAREADWLLCYGCRFGRFDAAFDPVWEEGDAYVIARRAA